MKLKRTATLAVAFAISIYSSATAQESRQKIDELEDTISRLQAELNRLKSAPDSVADPANTLPTPADQQPSLDFAPGYQPGSQAGDSDAPTVIQSIPEMSGTESTSPDLIAPPTGTIVLPEVSPLPTLPPYQRPAYRPPYSAYDVLDPSCPSGYDCPYRANPYRVDRTETSIRYRPPYSVYRFEWDQYDFDRYGFPVIR